MSNNLEPISRKEIYYANALGQYNGVIPEPSSRTETFLKAVCEKIKNGGITTEQLTTIISGMIASGELVVENYDDTTIKNMIGSLSNLTTTDKSSLVAAINEAKESGGSETGGGGNGLNFDNLTVASSVSDTVNESVVKQEYIGGYIEIQPDSWDGEPCETDSTTKVWGFPYSLLPTERNKIKNDLLTGNGTNIMYIRFPLGFAYRGYRNIDETSGLAKNIGERFKGQNTTLKNWFKDISEAGGGLAPEYWCPAPHWVTGGSYYNSSVGNELCAGGSYEQSVTLDSIRSTDPSQYSSQIDDFTNAIIDDLEYLHTNIAPVRMFGLQNEPRYAKRPYGACSYQKQVYNDVLVKLIPKIKASEILSTYNDEPNEIKILVASDDNANPFDYSGSTFISQHKDLIWGYTHHAMQSLSGEAGTGYGADWTKSDFYTKYVKGNRDNVFCNEYEYFSTTYGTDEFRCSNNMLRIINEAVYGGAKVMHPVIHICKPLGQTLSGTNTKGYCLYETNLNGDFGVSETAEQNTHGLAKGTCTPNKTMYNSWKMFGENLPVGAYVVGSYTKSINNGGWVIYKYDSKLYVFLANNSANNIKITLTFDDTKTFEGKAYDLNHLGDKIQSKHGRTISFVIPAYSGQAWIEKETQSGGDTPVVTNYTVTNNLTNCDNGNQVTTVAENSSYSATITANNGYTLGTVTVTMGGTDVTSTVYSDGNINITSVTGDIIITATATETAKIECTGLTLDKSTLEFTSNATQTLTATKTPSNTTDSLTWSVSPGGIVTVVNGVVTPVSNGSATITATCGSQTATCSVTVNIEASTTTYTITNNLTNCTNNNSNTSIEENLSYSAIITASSGYELSTVTVTMGGTDISSTAVSGGNISISSVTGNIVITAAATAQSSGDVPENALRYNLGGINSETGENENSDTKIRTDFISVSGTIAHVKFNNGVDGTGNTACGVVRCYNSSKTYLGTATGALSTEGDYTLQTDTAYIRLVIMKSNSAPTMGATDLNGCNITVKNSNFELYYDETM